jgi:hypothetical protein
MNRGAGRPYHVLVLWPWPDDDDDSIGRGLVEFGGVPVAPGLGRLFGFATACARDQALKWVSAEFGPESVRAAGLLIGPAATVRSGV